MTGSGLSRDTTVSRDWRPEGFVRHRCATTEQRDTLDIEVALGLPSADPQAQIVSFNVCDARGTRWLDLGGAQARALGQLLCEAARKTETGAPAFDDERGYVVLDHEQLCIRFNSDEGAAPIDLISTDAAAFPSLGLYPVEAANIGERLIALADEIAQAAPLRLPPPAADPEAA